MADTNHPGGVHNDRGYQDQKPRTERRVEIVMPRMGLTMEEGTVVAWLKTENQPISAGEPMLEIETDKSTVEIESPAQGFLGPILAGPGETIPVGQVIGYISERGYNPSDRTSDQTIPGVGTKSKASPAARKIARELGMDLSGIQGTGPNGRVVAWNVHARAADTALPPSKAAVDASPKASPLAQRIAAEMAVDLAEVKGSGPGGRITRTDVETTARVRLPEKPLQAVQISETSDSPPLTPTTRAQQLMAERMSASFQTAPHFYLHVEVDARSLVRMRDRLKTRLKERFDVHLTFTDLLVKYCALMLRQHPKAMAQWTGQGYANPKGVHVGIAMDAPGGLIVPVIQNADQLGLAEIARQRQALSERAQNGKLMPQDLELGVFTISNLGMYGIDSFDAILNPPQAAILAVGRIKERALACDGQIVAAQMMTLSLSVDHRVLDGATAARFLGELVELIEMPELAQA